ncbi:RNA polymerase I termination factor [Carica papaya]|uniref:RNA polymerase I termination factor n=1 Tax=Carica papaya TaxID=3649 RepID=UPI000B8D008D|nr:RNA polymerase I termination factor [Carica papaya]
MAKKRLEKKLFNVKKNDGEEGNALEENDCDNALHIRAKDVELSRKDEKKRSKKRHLANSIVVERGAIKNEAEEKGTERNNALPIRAKDVELSNKDEKKKSKKSHLVNSIDIELGATQIEAEEKGTKRKKKKVESDILELEAKRDGKRRHKEKNKDGSIDNPSMIQEINDKLETIIKDQQIPGREEATEMLHREEGNKSNRKEKKQKRQKEGGVATMMDNITDENDGMEHLDDKALEKVKSKKDEKKKKQQQNDDLGARREGNKGANDDKDCMGSGGSEAKGGNIEFSSVNAEDVKKDKKKKKVKLAESGTEEKGHKAGKRGKRSVKTSVPSENPMPNKRSKKVSFSDHVEVFPSSDDDGNGNVNQEDGLVRGKRFSKEEDEILKEAVSKYIEAHGLGEEGIEMIMRCSSYPETKNCWKEIGAALPWRPKESVYYRAHILFERDEKRSWTAEEYELIRRFHEKHGSDWRTLGDALGKHRIHVKDTWRRIKLPSMKKGQWSQEEYQSLFDLVNMDLRMKSLEEKKSKHGMLRDNICWEAISQKLETRSNSTCCRKWYYQLTSPMVAEGKWVDADDYRLLDALLNLDACCIEDVEWANLLEHRTGDICRKRWDQMHRHIGELGVKTFPEQVEILSKRYCPDLLEAREAYDNRPTVP